MNQYCVGHFFLFFLWVVYGALVLASVGFKIWSTISGVIIGLGFGFNQLTKAKFFD